ncbi:hypothetical protein [Sphingobacterium faecium]|uniref:hypothetical protein n=1 Tax=Sphingobacterium faecium TaxID=34087 RepID=UPI0024797565|nr:hypothetical protein [Sphingobacterium faecium]WGQ15587.1 hypothetical protein QG727_04065 [Sphingobacterium faecium]
MYIELQVSFSDEDPNGIDYDAMGIKPPDIERISSCWFRKDSIITFNQQSNTDFCTIRTADGLAFKCLITPSELNDLLK